MPVKAMKTLDDLRTRCEIVEATGCWRWKGARSHGGAPNIWMRGVGATSLQVALPILATGERGDESIRYIPTCGDLHCMNWAHRRAGTNAELQALIAATYADVRAAALRRASDRISEGMQRVYDEKRAGTYAPKRGPKLHDKLEPLHTRRGPAMPALRKPGSNARPIPVQQPAPTEARITDKTRVTVAPACHDQRFTVRELPPGYVSALDPAQARPWAQAAAQGRGA